MTAVMRRYHVPADGETHVHYLTSNNPVSWASAGGRAVLFWAPYDDTAAAVARAYQAVRDGHEIPPSGTYKATVIDAAGHALHWYDVPVPPDHREPARQQAPKPETTFDPELAAARSHP